MSARLAAMCRRASGVVAMAVFTLAAGVAAAAPPAPHWVPRGELAKVLVIDDCTETAGDAMATRLQPPTIYVCRSTVRLARREQPGIEVFFLAHEYGHVALQTADESFADCWAARELAAAPNGRRAIDAAIALFSRRAGESGSRYGTGSARAGHIRDCAAEAGP